MLGVESTPSVDFQFEDSSTSRHRTRTPLQETEVKYEFSCTNDKKSCQFSHREVAAPFDISRQLRVVTPYEGDSINTEDFFQDFESKFVVTFDDASRQVSSPASNSPDYPLENQQNSSILQNKQMDAFLPIRLSIQADFKQEYLDRSLCRINQLKSDIIAVTHKSTSHPMFAIKKKKEGKKNEKKILELKSDKITKKRERNREVFKLNFPQTCRHFQQALWNSNPGLEGSLLFKRLHKKVKKRISPFRVKQTSQLQKSLQSTNQTLSIKGKNKPFSKYKVENRIEKSNIFVKLPSLR